MFMLYIYIYVFSFYLFSHLVFVCQHFSYLHIAWWRHQMEKFSTLLALCQRNSPVTGEFPSQMPVTQSFDVFFDPGWTNIWANQRDVGDLRYNRAHYDVTIMVPMFYVTWLQINDIYSFVVSTADVHWWVNVKIYISHLEPLLLTEISFD